MRPKKFYKYHKALQDKDLLEELLRRKKGYFQENKLTNFSTTRSSNYNANRVKSKNKLPTIFKSIGYRKSYNSLNIAIKYVLKNTNQLENDMEEVIQLDNINQEISRFDLTKDNQNTKGLTSSLNNKNIEDKNLKNRQIWHAIFSLPNNESKNTKLFKEAIHKSLNELLKGHKYLIGIHKNTKHMHCHILVKTKNDLTKKQIRINPLQLKLLHQHIHKNCLEKRIVLEVKGSIKNKKAKLTTAYNKLKLWKNMYKNNSFTKLYVNERIYTTLSNLGLKENDINSFLHMYNEDKKLAIWTLNKNAKVFNINNPQHSITLRKVKISQTPILQNPYDKNT